jgi:hypothetical protein
MLPDDPWLRKCPSEGVMFWSDECEEIGRIEFSDDEEGPEWTELDYAEAPTEADLVEALQSGLDTTPEKERYIRMSLWWAGNDLIRRRKSTRLSDAHLENLRSFADLLSEGDDNQRLMKAEVLRQTSQFEAAMRILEAGFPDEFSDAVKRIRVLAAAGDCKVAKIHD